MKKTINTLLIVFLLIVIGFLGLRSYRYLDVLKDRDTKIDSLRGVNSVLVSDVINLKKSLQERSDSLKTADSLYRIWKRNDSIRLSKQYQKKYDELFEMDDDERVRFFLSKTGVDMIPIEKVEGRYVLPMLNIDSANKYIIKTEYQSELITHQDYIITELESRCIEYVEVIAEYEEMTEEQQQIIINSKIIIKNQDIEITELKKVIHKRDNRDRWIIIGGIGLLIYAIAK